MRVATIDIGTNSVLLLIAEHRGPELVPVLERATITRLGRGVDRTRALDAEAVAATLACLAEYAAEIQRAGVERVDAVGTSAMRDAQGGEQFRARAAEILGCEPRVISGDEEADLTFAGALAGLSIEGPVVVFDLGGGSTEIIRGRASARGDTPDRGVSLDIGSVRLTERHLHADPPRADEIAAARRDARTALDGLGTDWLGDAAGGAARLVGVAGTVTTLAAYALGVAPYDPSRVHGARLDAATIARVAADLARVSLAERRALPAIDPKRADVIVAGATIVEEVLSWSGAAELIVSDRGVRWGLAKRLAS
ncbi:Exopolyphosphatase [Minicystis rosea]|nr:Exopolyphosphatase [Minicystis rosea]